MCPRLLHHQTLDGCLLPWDSFGRSTYHQIRSIYWEYTYIYRLCAAVVPGIVPLVYLHIYPWCILLCWGMDYACSVLFQAGLLAIYSAQRRPRCDWFNVMSGSCKRTVKEYANIFLISLLGEKGFPHCISFAFQIFFSRNFGYTHYKT